MYLISSDLRLRGSNSNPCYPKRKRQNNTPISTFQMVERLGAALYDYSNDKQLDQYIQPYTDGWNNARSKTGSRMPSFDSLVTAVRVNVNPENLVSFNTSQLCPAKSWTSDPTISGHPPRAAPTPAPYVFPRSAVALELQPHPT
jgi:hypothetical protein